mmetsp:Transcript_17047/g.48676  ORF Transcript_17047/g.48676 Transcript_17047/m.48676 type:complete len:345 (-) Transcript_17047:562-1596(-)
MVDGDEVAARVVEVGARVQDGPQDVPREAARAPAALAPGRDLHRHVHARFGAARRGDARRGVVARGGDRPAASGAIGLGAPPPESPSRHGVASLSVCLSVSLARSLVVVWVARRHASTRRGEQKETSAVACPSHIPAILRALLLLGRGRRGEAVAARHAYALGVAARVRRAVDVRVASRRLVREPVVARGHDGPAARVEPLAHRRLVREVDKHRDDPEEDHEHEGRGQQRVEGVGAHDARDGSAVPVDLLLLGAEALSAAVCIAAVHACCQSASGGPLVSSSRRLLSPGRRRKNRCALLGVEEEETNRAGGIAAAARTGRLSLRWRRCWRGGRRGCTRARRTCS